MGRPCRVSNQEAILLIQKYIQYFNTNNFPSSSAIVWKDMSTDLNGRWKPHSVYTYVRENRNGSLETARQNLGINIEPPVRIPLKSTIEFDEYLQVNTVENTIVNEQSEDSESDKSCYDDENEDFDIGVDSFPLILSPTEWEQIKPDQTSNHQQRRLKSRIWPNVITKAFWNMYKFPCAFLGKWSYIRMEHKDENENNAVGSFYLKFKGFCKSKKCNNKIVGVAHKQPVNEKLHLIITTRDTRNDYHEEVKRPLNGPERKLIGRKLKRKRVAGYRQRLLAENMEFGENEPPWIQKCHIYRQAKMETNKEDLGIKSNVKMDMMTSIRNMLQDIRYGNTIREIGAKKFYVFYCSPEQIFVQKEYCRVTKGFSRICLDATGKVVNKFEIFPGRKTGHIFLYTVTINFEGKTLPVYQMLSEKHDAVFITFWLQEWIRACKATIPNEAISDLGRALLLAMCEAFNRMTLKEYVDVLFKWATKDRHKTPQPFNTAIRADVAHQMAAVARWKCIKDLRHPIVKGFYLRTIALMIECQTVQEFERIFRLTCIVALHLDQDENIMVSGKQVSVFEARRLLEENMAEQRQIIEELQTSSENIEIDKELENSFNLVEEDDKNLTVTHQWIKNIISMSTPPDQQKIECKAVNGFYFPEFIKSLERIAKEFPIWTAAGLPGKQTHVTTASQEGYFAEIKHKVFEGIHLPCSANRFLKEHIDDLHSGTNEIAAKLKHFNHNHRQPVSSPHIPKKESVLQKSARDANSFDKESESPQKGAPVTCLFDEKLGFLPHELISDSCLLDNILGVFSQDSTSTACTANKELKLTLKKSASCLADIESAPSVQTSASGPCSAEEESKSLQQPYTNINFNSMFRERARMINDSDLKSGETWKGLINDDSCFADTNEISFENQDESRNVLNTSEILSDILDFQSGDIANIDENLFINPNNNTHYSTNDKQDQFCTKNGSTLTAELSTPNSEKVIFSSTPLIDHNYSQLSDEEVPTKFPKDDQRNLNPKCSKEKSAKVGFYFQSYPQIRFLNERFDNGGKRGFFFKNGLKLGIIKIGNIAVDLQMTWGFDSIIHILQFGALYDSQYHFSIQSSNNRALKFVCKFMKMGPTMGILRERIILLNEFYPIVKDPEAPCIKPHKLNAYDSINGMWKKLFCCSEPTEPSAIRSSECNNSECVCSLPTDVANFEVNLRMINSKGIRALQDAILFKEKYYNVKCQQKDCPGTVIETTRPNFHIFIDLDTRTHRKETHGLKCQLADFPITLNLVKQYRLIGVIEHIPGHFIGYCRKPSGRWLKCDDMQSNVEGCAITRITPIGAIYIVL